MIAVLWSGMCSCLKLWILNVLAVSKQSARRKQLDDGIVDTFVLVDVFGRDDRSWRPEFNRFASRAEAAIVTRANLGS